MNQIKENVSMSENLEAFVETNNEGYTPGRINKLMIVSRPGVGKTKALMQLKDAIYFDLEDSTGHFEGKASVVNIKKIAKAKGWGPIKTIKMMTNYLKEQGKQYKYCIIDTISVVDDLAEGLALANYQATKEGRNYTGSIFDLEWGKGYTYCRDAFKEIMSYFEGLGENTILVAHVKDSSIKKNGVSVSVTDIRLTGALREIISCDQDASAIMVFDKKEPNMRYLDFRKSEENEFMKCRPSHLAGKMILISETTESGEFKTFWENVFI